MSKHELFQVVVIYFLVILISSLRPFWNQLGSRVWMKNLAVQWDEPVIPKGEMAAVTVQPVRLAWKAHRRILPFRKTLDLSVTGITTAKQISTQEPIAKANT